MDFVHLLMHSLVDVPVNTTSMPITYYLPKNTTMDGSHSAFLFYPQASGHIQMPAGMQLSFHPLPAYGILYVSRGTGHLSCGSRNFILTANSFVLFDGKEGFSITSNSNLEHDLLYFNGAPTQCYYDELKKLDGLYISALSSSGLSSLLRPLLPGGAAYGSPFGFHRALTDFLSELIDYSSASEQGTSVPDYLRQLREYLDENFFKDITLEGLESLFGVNRYRLCREFREHFDQPPLQYLHGARIAKAKLLLAETTLKVHEISYQVGYENPNQFIHHFKKITGWTPAAYREKRR
ncbi:MAG: helix-turn-helix transcriptional regulator [Lachnospiraceae bacterium]|nr:helix-turn-helix transcriptional regulator [Lachnospiraceae bacterium]